MSPNLSHSAPGNLVLPLFCLAAVIANQAIFRFGAMSPLWAVFLLATIAALYVASPRFDQADLHPPRGPLGLVNVLIALLVLAPLLADFALGWNREFPFSGDSYFHVGQSYRIALWWLSPVASDVVTVPSLDDVRRLLSHPLGLLTARVVVLVVLVGLTAFLYRRRPPLALGFAALTFVIWGWFEATIFLRYPGARYLIDLPFLGPAFLLNDLELAGRLSNIVCAVAWLFILRPWLIGRWPDVAILPVALLLFWQKDVIYYFDSVYAEPCALLLALLAVELLIVKGRDGAPLACLLIGAAGTVKEPFILALPFMWLAGEPWRRNWRDLVSLTAAAVAAGVPFVIYLAARKSIDVAELGSNRSFDFFVSMEGLSRYAHETLSQWMIAFPGASGLLAVLVVALIPVMLAIAPGRRVVVACLLGAACFVASLFVFDRVSQRWAGYFRFLMCVLPFLTAGLFVLTRSLQKRWALAMAGLVLLVQAPSAYAALERSAGVATDRNFVEYYDAPIVFPIKSLMREARQAGALPPGAAVAANSADATLRSFPGSPITYGPFGELYCKCEASRPNVLALFIRFTNMSRKFASEEQLPNDRVGIWQRTNARRQQCLAELKASCAHVFTRIEGGELVGALGTSR